MKQGWEIKKLGELCTIKGRIGYRGYTKQDLVSKGEGAITLSPSNIVNCKLQFNNSTYISWFKYNESPEIKINIGDIIYCKTASIGKLALVEYLPEMATINPQFVVFKELKCFNKFLYYGLLTEDFKLQASEIISGTAIPTLSQTNLAQLVIPTPPLSEQQRIVSILDQAFAAIDKAKANAEQNLKNTKELFESYLQGVFEKKGDEWAECTVRECVERGIIHKPLDGNHGEIHPTKTDFVSTGIPFIMSRDMSNGGVDETGCNFISEKQARTLRTGFAKDGDVLLSHKGTIGTVSILRTDKEFIVLTPQITFYRIKNKEKLIKEFLYYYFLNSGFQKEINSIAQGGSTRAYIGITKQLDLKLVLAPLKEQQTIVHQLDALKAETKRLEAIYQQKINNLEELKKSILDKAFKGEL